MTDIPLPPQLASMLSEPLSREKMSRQWDEPARKRMRITPPDDNDDDFVSRQERPSSAPGHGYTDKDKDKSMTIASTAKLAPQTVAPFLAKNIPSQYAALGPQIQDGKMLDGARENNSKYCYRHRPDTLCRRQADEYTMEKLQKDLETLPQEERQGIVQVWSLFSAGNPKHRNMMLQGILAQCCFPQLSFLSANVRELIRIDFIAALPSEISFRILCFLDTTSLCKAAQVSRKWRQLADDDVVWHRMCEQHIDRKCTRCGWGLPLLERKRLRASKRLIQLRASNHGAESEQKRHQLQQQNDAHASREVDDARVSDIEKSADGRLSPVLYHRSASSTTHSDFVQKTRPWKDVYKDRFRVGTNWKYGRFNLKILKGHTNGVTALQMYDNILATGSYDDTIKIWDLETGKELRTLSGHTMGIRCLQIDDTKLISGSLDKTLKVWNWRTGECLATYPGHADGIIGLHFDANILVSGSIDRTARVWDFKGKSFFTLRGHEDWVNAVRIDTPSQTVFTASDDCTIKMWDLETRRCIHTFMGHVCQVQQVLLLPPEFDAEDDSFNQRSEDPGSPDSQRSFNASFHRQVSPELARRALPSALEQLGQSHTMEAADPFAGFAAGRARPPRYMLTSALDSTIRLWEVHTGRCVRTFFGHLEGVWSIAADTLRIVSGAEDRMVKVWDPRSGKCERTFTGHLGPVTCIGLSDSRMVSASEDGEIRVHCYND